MSKISQFYRDNGYYIHPSSILSADLIARASTGMDMIRQADYDTGRPPYESPWNPGDPMDILCKVENPQLANKAIGELINSLELGRLAAEATGAEMIQAWWVQMLYKPTSKAGEVARNNVGMHQDFYYWQNHWEDDSELFTAWIPLIDATPAHGTMLFIPGSHHWGLSEDSDFFGQDLEAQKAALEAKGHAWSEHYASYVAGAFSLHHKLTWHGSGPNVMPEPRRSLAIHLRTEKSKIKNGRRDGLTELVENLEVSPVIFGNFSLQG